MNLDDRATKQQLTGDMSFLAIRGELAALVRSRDWSATPIGPVKQWPQSLKTAVSILLTSRYAMWMGWGSELTFLYNDAYTPTLGIKHPWALGAPADQVWAEIWPDIGPRIEIVLSTREATYDEGLLLILERSGFPEETYHTFSYSPLRDDTGRVNGMFCVVTEETERIISERRLATLGALASALSSTNTEAEVYSAITHRLGENLKDLPFTLTYLYDSHGQARLVGSTGISGDHPAAPESIPAGHNEPWPAFDFFRQPVSRVIDNWYEAWSGFPHPAGAWNKPPRQVVMAPIKQQGQDRPAGFLIAAVNPFRRYDAAYSGFIDLIAGQIAAGLANSRAYEAERRRAESLMELDRAKTAFFSNVSHEFRTPLTLMLGPVEDLLTKSAGGNDRELLEVVQRNGLRLQKLVNTLLDFSRIEAGRVQANYEPVDLGSFTTELASSFRSAMERASLRFHVDCPALRQPVYVDREMWEKVVLNLLSNAFKYTLTGSITVRLREQHGGAELSVVDTGVGIPEQDLPHLFERFHRAESTRGRTHEGTGIGLALVLELVKLHGGFVKAQSTVGRGSTFSVFIPFGMAHLPPERVSSARASAHAALHAESYVAEALRWLPEETNARGLYLPDDPLPGATRRSRVLLADDNADMRDYVRRLLGPRYEVTAVSNGHAAVRSALLNPPDLVLTDVMMPDLDGFGVLDQLRKHEQTKTLPILLLSARAGEESRVEGMNAGADDYIVKPFTARELLARVEAHLSLARMRQTADRARRMSEARLGLALEATRMYAWEWDPASDEVITTGDMRGIFGAQLTKSEEGFRLVDPADEPGHREKFERVAREGGSYRSEFRITKVDTGAMAWLEERATAITDAKGRVQRMVGVVVDVTDRKAAEEELQHKNDELTRANRELEEFAYVASHDLREPLRTVNIYTQLLLKRYALQTDREARVFAEYVRTGVMRMEELIKDLLFYSRVVHPEQDPARPADLNRSLEEALEVLKLQIDQTGASIAIEPLPVVHGEERQLSLVFQNLISNALKYRSGEGAPKIRISAERRGEEWIVKTVDDGIGFDPSYAERIFGLFKRLHKEEYPGTGLGLAICKRIVERYGGRIWAESKGDGRGAEFSLALRSVEKIAPV